MRADGVAASRTTSVPEQHYLTTQAARLNATDDVVARWAAGCTVLALHPYGTPVEAPGHYGAASGARPVPPSSATTAGWRPWHWRGRPRRRRGNRLPDEG